MTTEEATTYPTPRSIRCAGHSENYHPSACKNKEVMTVPPITTLT
jgi:hypothetical protein